MRPQHVRFLGILSVMFAASLLGAGVTAPAFAAVSCGDIITADTTIAPGDPITLAPCPCAPSPPAELFALKVVGNGVTPVILDLNFQIIRGLPACEVGVLIEGDLVTVKSGKITGFGFGVATWGPTWESTLAGLQVSGNGDGIAVTANNSTIRNNVSLLNGNDGFSIDGSGTTIKQNRSERNGGEGFKIEGAWHTVTLNNSLRNGENGYAVSATDSLFDRNRGDYNAGFGFVDWTVDSGTAGTANTYTGNRCTGNGAGKSSPAGLCK